MKYPLTLLPPNIVKQFINMGAVRCAVLQLNKIRWLTGVSYLEGFNDIVYFFDKNGLELGHMNQYATAPMIFKNGREWHKTVSDCHKFFNIGELICV